MLHFRWSLIGIGIAITLSLVTEYQINTVPAVAALRLKSIPAFVALASFVVVYSVYWYKVRPKITTGLAVFVGGLVLLSVIGLPLWFWLAALPDGLPMTRQPNIAVKAAPYGRWTLRDKPSRSAG